MCFISIETNMFHGKPLYKSKNFLRQLKKENSTAPFLGMNAKWNQVFIPSQRKIFQLKRLFSKTVEISAMGGIWAYEFNKSLFVWWLNNLAGCGLTFETYDDALAWFPSIYQAKVDSHLLQNRLKILKTHQPTFKDLAPIVEIAKQYSREEIAVTHSIETNDRYSFRSISGSRHLIIGRDISQISTVFSELEEEIEKKIDVIVIDPPYGLEAAQWDTVEESESFAVTITTVFEYLVSKKTLSKDFKVLTFCLSDSKMFDVSRLLFHLNQFLEH